MNTTSRLGQILGPGAAGLLIAVIPEVHFFTVNAATLLVSSLSVAIITRQRPVRQSARRRDESFRGDVLDGLRRITTVGPAGLVYLTRMQAGTKVFWRGERILADASRPHRSSTKRRVIAEALGLEVRLDDAADRVLDQESGRIGTRHL